VAARHNLILRNFYSVCAATVNHPKSLSLP
jgi:hypothetical protein